MTHAFVQLCINPSPLEIKPTEYYIAIRNKPAFFRGSKKQGSDPTIVETRKRNRNSPFGTVVWLAGKSIKVIRSPRCGFN